MLSFASFARRAAAPRLVARPAARHLHADSVNPNVKNMQYAVRGALVLRAGALEAQLRRGESLPFDEIIYCNIGNPQQLEQPPLTYVRSVLAAIEYPPLLAATSLLAPDAIARAQAMLAGAAPSTGAYTHSKGLEFVRQHVAEFIEARDGHASNPEHIFLSDGASPAVKMALNLLVRGPGDGVLIPTPQYPLYSASIALLGGAACGYYLDEARGWSLSVDELDAALRAAEARGVAVRALAVINPGNPTGQVMEYADVARVAEWAAEKQLVLLADEVYQANVYAEGKQFHSFKKVVRDLKLDVPLMSFHSTSKGVLGECGKRGGYMEACNIDDEVLDLCYKFASVSLCPNVTGQLTVDLMVKPPAPGEESYEQYQTEYKTIFESLKSRAATLAEMLNSLEGVSCNPPEGSMYAFPRITLSQAAQDAAAKEGLAPDAFYSMRLLEATGICVVPGSGFGQREGEWHVRTTFLPAAEKVDKVATLMKRFHADFIKKYGI